MMKHSFTRLFLLINPAHAWPLMVFKKDTIMSTPNYINHALIIISLLALMLFLVRYKQSLKQPRLCCVKESISLNYKTKLYVIEYQQQQFLIADNLNSLAIQLIPRAVSS